MSLIVPPFSVRRHLMQSGLSLTELLVAIATMAVIAAILFGAFGKSKEQARFFRCVSQLRQIGQAYHAYAAEHNGKFPESTNASKVVNPPSEVSHIGTSARGYPPDVLVNQRYLLDMALFYCPVQKDYIYPDQTTSYGRAGWAAEGYYIGYLIFHLRDYTSTGGNGYPQQKNARVIHNATLPLMMDLTGRELHGDQLNVLYLDGRVGQVSSRYLLSLRTWPERIQYMQNPSIKEN